MPGFFLDISSIVHCPHMAMGVISTDQVRVATQGGLVATMTPGQTKVVGCLFAVGLKPQPCALVVWSVPSTRVFVDKKPVVCIVPGGISGMCYSADAIPAMPPVTGPMQTRVYGS